MISLFQFFSILFFVSVVSVGAVGLLLDELSFLWLAVFNFVILAFAWLITLFFKKSPSVKDNTKQETQETPSEVNHSKTTHHTYHQNFVKYTHNVSRKKRKLGPVLLLSLFGLVALGILLSNLGDDEDITKDSDTLSGYSASILNVEDTTGNQNSGVIVESTGQVLSTGVVATTGLSVNDAFVSTGSTATPSVQKPAQSYAPSTLKFKSAQSVSLLEAVIYLLQTRDVKLNTSKDLKFNGVSLTNPYYKYWYTATKMGLVGSTSSPTSLISCQTYMVLKGMVEKRDVQYTSANVKTQYWAEAQKRDVLNGCVFGKILKGANLD